MAQKKTQLVQWIIVDHSVGHPAGRVVSFRFFFSLVLLEKESALPVVSKEFKNYKNVNNLHI